MTKTLCLVKINFIRKLDIKKCQKIHLFICISMRLLLFLQEGHNIFVVSVIYCFVGMQNAIISLWQEKMTVLMRVSFISRDSSLVRIVSCWLTFSTLYVDDVICQTKYYTATACNYDHQTVVWLNFALSYPIMATGNWLTENRWLCYCS